MIMLFPVLHYSSEKKAFILNDIENNIGEIILAQIDIKLLSSGLQFDTLLRISISSRCIYLYYRNGRWSSLMQLDDYEYNFSPEQTKFFFH